MMREGRRYLTRVSIGAKILIRVLIAPAPQAIKLKPDYDSNDTWPKSMPLLLREISAAI